MVKGADFIENAIRALQVAGIRATIHLVGGARVDAYYGAGVQVVRHGHASHQELAEIFGGADCLLLPSRLESFGMVVLEAMAAGMSVIVSDWVGAAALVDHGVNGWRFGDTFEAFLERVLWCADNVDLVRAMRPACVETARRNSWEAYQQRAVNIVRNVTRGS
ncbi:glycosyltransferase family 4 protein [Thermomonas sp. HDW16]|nr:glycosyltransferase family 4 protein [Thermomonas sp. HDW16]